MKAFCIVEPGKSELIDIKKPQVQEGEVLLNIGHVGFCGGDLNAFRGTFPMQHYPMVIGHEVGAVIEEVAKEVPDHIKPGLKVTLSPYENCGVCSSCKNNRPNACRDNRTMGVRRPGAMTEYLSMPWSDLYFSPILGTKELALVEPLTVGFHAATRGRVSEADKVAVFGCGLVGLGAIAGSTARGAEVIAIDVIDRKLNTASSAGAKHTINTDRVELHNALLELTDGLGPDVCIEAVGLPDTYRAAVEEVCFTGRVVYIGYAKKNVEFETRLFVQKELDILGSRNCLGEFTDVIDVLEKKQFPIDEVISKVISIDDAPDTLETWSNNPGDFTKIMVSF